VSGVAPGGTKFSGGNGGAVPFEPWTGAGGGGAAGPNGDGAAGGGGRAVTDGGGGGGGNGGGSAGGSPSTARTMAVPAAMAAAATAAVAAMPDRVPGTGVSGQAVVAEVEDISLQVMVEMVPAAENSTPATDQAVAVAVAAGTTAP